MPDPAAIRDGIVTNLRGIRESGVQVSGYQTSSPTPPGIQVAAGETLFDLAMARGLDIRRFVVQAFVDFSSDTAPQALLDELLAPDGERSVKQAVESDRTLGGLVDNVRVVRVSRPALVDRPGGSQILVAEFDVEVHTSN